jgi:hypothetical protein
MLKGEPGLVILFGSGETAASSGKAHEHVAKSLKSPPNIAILETPAGFEPNSPQVAGRVGDFLATRLQNYHPTIHIIPARKKGTPHSPDNPEILAPIFQANWLFLGPGSPTYAARQLKDSLALHMIAARHRLGAALMLASSATLAFSAYTMPVYEIYKVGMDLHWQEGINFFGAFGLPLVVVPHWNNTDGGDELDTSRCYMGKARFSQLMAMLPAGQTIVGLDEHTALVIDKVNAQCQVMGNGRVVIHRQEKRTVYQSGDIFHPNELGQWRVPQPGEGIPPAIWEQALAAHAKQQEEANKPITPPDEILALVKERTAARQQKQWAKSDALRDQIHAKGWLVKDTPSGPELEPVGKAAG